MTEPVPTPGAPNRTPIVVAVVAVVVAVIVATIVVLTNGNDDDTAATGVNEGTSSSSTVVDRGSESGSEPSTSSVDPQDAPAVTVTGSALPTGVDEGPDDPAIGEKLPGIAGVGYDGTPVDLDGDGARLIVVMAHWCPHCQREVPRIVEWAADGALPDDVQLLGLSTAVVEERGNYPPSSWLAREGFDFPVLADDAEATGMQALGAEGFPTFVAVGADGRVVARVSGEIERDQFDELVQAAQDGAAS